MRRNTVPIKNLIIFFVFSVLMVTSYLFYFGKLAGFSIGITSAGVLYTFAFVLGLYIIKLKTGTYGSLMTFFWVSFFLFHGGQIVLYMLRMADFTSYNIFKIFKTESIIKATLYSTICELMFCAGMYLNKVKNDRERVLDIDSYFLAMRKIARVMLIISVVPFLYYMVAILRVGTSVGYGALNDFSNYSSATLMKVVMLFVDIFIVGAYFEIIANYNNKFLYRFFICVVLVYSLIFLAIGDRTEPTSLIVLILWIDSYLCTMFGKKGKARKKKVISALVLSVLILVFPSVMALRHSGLVTVSGLVGNVKEIGAFESFKESVAGIGVSMMPLIEVRRLVAAGEPLRYGITYLAACTNVVPYLGFAKKYAGLSTWLMNKLNIGYGPGFSMAAEAYLNFGDFPISIVVLGFLFSKVLMWDKDKIDIRKMIRGVIFITACLTLPRRELSSRMRELVYLVMLLPVIVDFVYNKCLEKRSA